MRRIILIVWKWQAFEANTITEESLQQEGYKLNKYKITEVKDTLFDEFNVAHRGYTLSDFKLVEPKAMVIRLRMKHQEKDVWTKDFLLKLIKYYEAGETKLFVFLHRRDGFTNATINSLLRPNEQIRYFLFGYGRDYIYYNTQKEGLLGESGRFEYRKPSPKAPLVKVADTRHKLVFQPHFDKVWDYYEHEFYSKIYELKEDILSYFFALVAKYFDHPFKDYLKYLNEYPPLLWRIKSFMGQKCDCFLDQDKKLLENYGLQQQKSYIFDDCRANLARVTKVGKEYDDVVDLLDLLLFRTAENIKGTLRQNLEKLNIEFEELLEAIDNNFSIYANHSSHIQ